jgi:hypothetical protein
MPICGTCDVGSGAIVHSCEISNTQLKAPRTDRSRMKMTLIADDGAWKIDSLSLL